jgi:hypothetical protein
LAFNIAGRDVDRVGLSNHFNSLGSQTASGAVPLLPSGSLP